MRPDVQPDESQRVILVVDDDPTVRGLISRSLRDLKYQVLEADNGQEALRTLEESHAAVDLVITDLIMPEMSGNRLIDELHDKHPQIKILIVTAYNRDAVIRQGALLPGARYLAKPFRIEDLANAAREMLKAG